VTDAGLVHLKGMTRLQSLRLIDTQITGDDQKNPDKLSLHDL
jgi:hypothetical protein